MAGRCQVRMEVVIQRHAYARIVSGGLQNIGVLCPIHPDLGDMNSIEAFPAKDRGCMRS
jgi:hypothetical protein